MKPNMQGYDVVVTDLVQVPIVKNTFIAREWMAHNGARAKPPDCFRQATGIGPYAEMIALRCHASEIRELHAQGKRCMFIMRLELFPRVLTEVDSRDQVQRLSGRTDLSADRVRLLWATYTVGQIPVVVINDHVKSITLRLVNV